MCPCPRPPPATRKRRPLGLAQRPAQRPAASPLFRQLAAPTRDTKPQPQKGQPAGGETDRLHHKRETYPFSQSLTDRNLKVNGSHRAGRKPTPKSKRLHCGSLKIEPGFSSSGGEGSVLCTNVSMQKQVPLAVASSSPPSVRLPLSRRSPRRSYTSAPGPPAG